VLEPSAAGATLGCSGRALSGRVLHDALAPTLLGGHNLERCPSPIGGPLPAGQTLDFDLQLHAPYLTATEASAGGSTLVDAVLHVEAAGGRVHTVVRVPAVGYVPTGGSAQDKCASF
jgi:hypothetical protein